MRFAAGPGVPQWAVGKTAPEILELSKQMADALAATPAARPQTPPAVALVAPQAPASALPSNDDWALNPTDAAQRQLEYNWSQRVAPVFDRLQNQLAGTSRGLVAQQHRADFDRWGPEIDQMVAPVPAEQRTAELYAQAVRLVRANHIDELASERANERLAALGVTDRTAGSGNPGVAPGTSGAVDLTKLDPAYKAAIEQMGIGPNELAEFLGKTRQTLEQFVESANRKQVITDAVWDRKGRSQVQVGLGQLYGDKVPVKEW
jgi:hypothetical protein